MSITKTKDYFISEIGKGGRLTIKEYLDPKREYDDLFALLLNDKERINFTRVEAATLVFRLGEILQLQYKDIE